MTPQTQNLIRAAKNLFQMKKKISYYPRDGIHSNTDSYTEKKLGRFFKKKQ